MAGDGATFTKTLQMFNDTISDNLVIAIGLYGNNITDKVYKTDAQEFSSVGEIRSVYYGAPRTFTLRHGRTR